MDNMSEILIESFPTGDTALKLYTDLTELSGDLAETPYISGVILGVGGPDSLKS